MKLLLERQWGRIDMFVNDLRRWIWFETWWKWNPSPHQPSSLQDILCHYFNLIEAAVWFVFAILVFRRWLKCRRSSLEIAYAFAFLVFGVSDVIEAWKLTSWLLWWKAVNLIILFLLRRTIIRRYYPDQRLF